MKQAFTRIFIKQKDTFNGPDQGHIDTAISRVMGDPTLNSYKRPYLGQHRQEHPANAQHTLFFEHIIADDVVLFVWLNDYSCLHTTRSHKDPCVEKFGDLKTAGDIDSFNSDYHLGKLTVSPNPEKPIYITFEALDYLINFHILNDGQGEFYTLMLSFSDNKGEDVESITKQVFKLFLSCFAEHLKDQGQNFEFRIEPNKINQELINIFNVTHDPISWNTSQDTEFYYLKLI